MKPSHVGDDRQSALLLLILTATLLLMLPISVAEPAAVTPPLTALFTATSAVCTFGAGSGAGRRRARIGRSSDRSC